MSTPLSHLTGILRRGSAEWGDRIALEDPADGRQLTYGDLAARARRGSGRLVSAGLRPGDCVLLVMDATTDWIPAFFAILEADLTPVPLPGGTPMALVGLAARHAGVRACIHDTSQATASLGAGIPRFTPDDLFDGAGPVDPPLAGLANPIAVLVFTSGSTARPRAVALGHDALLANLQALLEIRTAVPGETLLSVLPPAHLYELVCGQLAPLASGARIVCGGPPLPNRILDAIGERAVTRILLVPALLEVLVREMIGRLVADGVVLDACRTRDAAGLLTEVKTLAPGGRDRLRVAVRARLGSSLQSIAVGGAALSPAWADLLDAVGVAVDVGYGLTEAGPLVSMGRVGESPRGSVGRPLPGVEVRIAADGQVLVRSPSLMEGYAGDVSGTAAALEGGWLRTGDRGTLDESGCLTVAGRIKEAIVTASGDTLYPDEIEPYYASPLFAEHGVVPWTDRDGNDRPLLVVVPAPGTPPAVLDAAFSALRAAAPPRCRVAAMLRRDQPLPRTALGKIRRRLLADLLPLTTSDEVP